jgi:hypothetical protein
MTQRESEGAKPRWDFIRWRETERFLLIPSPNCRPLLISIQSWRVEVIGTTLTGIFGWWLAPLQFRFKARKKQKAEEPH